MATMTEARMLKVADRCDSCGAQAFVHVELENGSLLFCGHDFRKHEEVLRAKAIAVFDETGHINVKPSISANAE